MVVEESDEYVKKGTLISMPKPLNNLDLDQMSVQHRSMPGPSFPSSRRGRVGGSTGKSLSEALIFASTNPQYDNRLSIELHVQYMKIPSSEHGENMLYTEIVFDIQNNFCTQHVLQKEELLTKIYLYCAVRVL